MRVLLTLPFLLPVLVSAESRSVTGLPGSEPIAAWILAGLFLVLVLLTHRERGAASQPSSRLESLVGVLGGVLAAAFLPSPSREAAWIAAAAYACLGFGLRGSRALCVFSLSALAATLAHWCLPILLVRFDSEALAAVWGSWLLGALGAAAPATERGVGLLSEGPSTLELGLGWSHLGAREVLALLVGAAVAVATGRSLGLGLRDLLRFCAALACAVAVHVIVNALVLMETRSPTLLVDPWLRSVSIGVPALWCLMRLTPRPAPIASEEPHVPAAHRGAAPVALALAALGVFLLVAGAFWPGVGEKRGERIAVDEGHSNWERLDIPLDRDTFGTLAVYNYAEWIRGLERRHGDVARLKGELSDDVLARFDVLLLKTPTVPYMRSEVDAIHRFVENGGGLYMVGDHNDVFGMNTILNSVAGKYGIEYRPDALAEIEYDGGQVIDPASYPPHPITRTMKPMHYMTSCSMAISGPARPLLWMNKGYADDPDFSVNNFIGDGNLVGGERLAPLAQLASATDGEGKVLAFSDSTLFSNFSIYLPGVRELAFGGVEWLLWSERFPLWRTLATSAGVLLTGFGLWVLRRDGAGLGAAVVAGLAAGLFLADTGSRSVLEPWAHQLDGEEVVFDSTVSAGRLPIWHESHDEKPDNFWGAFIAFQRSGDFMRVALEEEELFTGKAAVLIWPKQPLSPTFMNRVRAFVAEGGALYVFDDRLADGSATNDILEPFGLRMGLAGAGRSITHEKHGLDLERSVMLESSAVVFGGEPWLLDDAQDPIVARAEYGHGLVVAAGVAQDLSGAKLGSPSELRGVRGWELLQLLYAVIDAARVEDPISVVAP